MMITITYLNIMLLYNKESIILLIGLRIYLQGKWIITMRCRRLKPLGKDWPLLGRFSKNTNHYEVE